MKRILLVGTAFMGISASYAHAQMVNAQTGTTYTVQNSDCGVINNFLVTFNNSSGVAVTLPEAGANGQFAGGCVLNFQNIGTGTVTITPTISTINGASTLTLTAGRSAAIFNDSTPTLPGNYWAQTGGSGGGGSGTVASSTVSQIPIYTGATTVTGGPNITASAGALTLGQSGTQGSVILNGSSSGTATLVSPAAAGGTITLPGATATLSTLGANIYTGAQTLPVGLVGTPSATFTSDLTTGIWQSATSNIDFGITGTNVFNIAAAGVKSQGTITAGGGNTTSLVMTGGTNVSTLQSTGGTNPTMAVRSSGSGIIQFDDANGVELDARDGGGAMVNHVSITGATTGNPPSVGVTNSSDANTSMNLAARGTGTINLNSGTNATRNITWANGQLASNTFYTASGSISGTPTGGSDAAANFFNVSSDTVAASTANLVHAVSINHAFGGALATGGRTGLNVFLNLTTATGNTGSTEYTAIVNESRATANDGGTNVTRRGQVWAQNAIARLESSATFFGYIVGLELDETVAASTAPGNKIGIKISAANGDADNGVLTSAGISIAGGFLGASVPAAGWTNGILFGEQDGFFPIISSGTIIGTQLYGTLPAAFQIRSPQAASGVDFSQVYFTSYFLNSAAFSVSGTGTTTSGALVITPTTAGVTLDTALQQSSVPVVTAGGTGFYVGDIVFIDGGEFSVATVSGTAIATLTQLVPGYSASPPGGNQAITGGSGGSAQATLTWTNAQVMSLNTSLGDVIIGASSALVNTATQGFFHLPFSNVTPTGTPATVAGDACQYNTASHTINCYDANGGAWHHITLSTGAG